MSQISGDEDIALMNAIYQSSLEVNNGRRFSQDGSNHLSPEREAIKFYQSNQLFLLQAPDSDVLVVLGAPPRQAHQSEKAYEATTQHFSHCHRIHSRSVLNLDSAKFNQLLGPSSQYRAERRLRKQGFFPQGIPEGVRYFLDLRPPSEDEDAVLLIVELTCSSGALAWFKAQQKYRIPRTMLCGHDEISPQPTEPASSQSQMSVSIGQKQRSQASSTIEAGPGSVPSQPVDEPDGGKERKATRIANWEGVFPTAPVMAKVSEDAKPVDTGEDVGEKANEAPSSITPQTPDVELQLEYSQLRHWSAIERLLHAIEGNDPMLDSAPKLWTYFAVASYFGCASNERISGWITTWLFAAPNNNFIQCNPEVSYRIGLGIQSEALIKDAFSILVGEKALMNAHRDNPPVQDFNPAFSVAGRRLGVLDDDELNRIDHAANRFARRIQNMYQSLIAEDMEWLKQSTAFQTVATFTSDSPQEETVARKLQECIQAFLRSRILWVLAREYGSDMGGIEPSPESVWPFYPHATAHYLIYNRLSADERKLSRFFWLALKQEQFNLGSSSVFTPALEKKTARRYSAQGCSGPAWSELAREFQQGEQPTKLLIIEKQDLYEWGEKFSKILHGRRASLKHTRNQKSAEDGTNRSWIGGDYPKDTAWPLKHPQAMHTDGKITSVDPALLCTTQQLDDLVLSSPKRTHSALSNRDLTENKRTCLGDSHIPDNQQQPEGKTSELPLRAAIRQQRNPAVPEAKNGTMKVARLQSANGSNDTGARYTYVDMEVPIPPSSIDSLPAKIGDGGFEFVEHAGSRIRGQQPVEASRAPTSFTIDVLLAEATRSMHRICDEVLLAAHLFRDGEVPPMDLIDTLMCLDHQEWIYLPLWAGGNDDGTGGVFEDHEVPNTESEVWNGGRRGLHIGGTSSMGGSSDWSEIVSTIGRASKDAINGTATETATVRSLSDLEMEMDFRSLGGQYSVTDSVGEAELESRSVRSLRSDDDDADEVQDDADQQPDDDGTDDGILLEFVDVDNSEEADWADW